MLIAFRQELVGRRVACQNRISALFAGQGLATPRGAAAWAATGLAGIAAQAQPLEKPLRRRAKELGYELVKAAGEDSGPSDTP